MPVEFVTAPTRPQHRIRLGVLVRHLGTICAWGALLACEVPSPQSPAEPIGAYPVWGRNFQQAEGSAAGGPSMLAGDAPAPAAASEGPAPDGAPNAAELSGPGGSSAPNMQRPDAPEGYTGGDAQRGQKVFLNHCALCHGAEGKGGMRPGVGMVPTLRDPAWHARMSDDRLASTIAHGKKAMPAFADALTRGEIADVVAYLRTLPGPRD